MVESVPDRPRWMWVAVGIAVAAIAFTMFWGHSVDSERSAVAWVNNGAQFALALLLFWYVLETRRVANETRRLVGQSEAQLAMLRREERMRLAPFVLPEVLPLMRADDPDKTEADYARSHADHVWKYLESHGIDKDDKWVAVKANPRQVRLRLMGDHLAQQVAVVVRNQGLGLQVRLKAVDVLSSSNRDQVIALPATWEERDEVGKALTAEYGSSFPLAALPPGGTFVAVILRDEGGSLVVFVRAFENDGDGHIKAHVCAERRGDLMLRGKAARVSYGVADRCH